MNRWWKCNLLKLHITVMILVLINFSFCSSLNNEGMALLKIRDRVVRDPFGGLSDWNYSEGSFDHCFWFGVECSHGRIVTLNLKDLCIEGTLAPELGKLAHLKSIILRNNLFYGNIPMEIRKLKELEVLDLGFNNFTGPFPPNLDNNLSILLLDNNEFLSSTLSPELHSLIMVSESQMDENQLTSTLESSFNCRSGIRTLLQKTTDVDRNFLERKRTKSHSLPPLSSISLPPITSISSPPESSPTPSPMESLQPSLPPPTPVVVLSSSPPFASPAPNPKGSVGSHSKRSNCVILIWSGAIGGSLCLFISVVGFFLCRRNKVITVNPSATGLSGQLQKALVTGVPKLQRSELETACEDFSNIIGSLSDGTVYKGTLSSGVEIAVTSTAVNSTEDWSNDLETKFRNKVEILSTMNHKNFVNLIGFCEEEEPFTRMMVFEYAPNGTLFEHLHIKEAEHLDWATRLRIVMGMAYCLDYMHQLRPPIAHQNLRSSSIYLTEDYASKISDFSFSNEATAAKINSTTTDLLEPPSSDPESNVYSFGVILFEMMTGQLPYSVGNELVEDWAGDYLKSERPLREMVDPTLMSFDEEEFEKLLDVVKDCVRSDPTQRLTMRGVTDRLKEITDMGPESVSPKVSPLWWAELEIMSMDSS